MSPDTPCPSAELLRRSLDPDDPMPAAERQLIEAHVDCCTQGCKLAIDVLLRGNTLLVGPGTAAAGNAPGAECPAHVGRYQITAKLGSGAFAAAPLTLPGYEILGEIARGGMGVVYKARQTGLDRLAAVKMMLAGAQACPDTVARFRVEAEAVARVRHPHIVQIYEVGECDGLPFLALEYMEGGSLAQQMARTPQPARVAAAMVETLARAVHAAHQQGVLHRDLKPANVLLTADGAPKIADFGLAKRLGADAGHTRTGEILGTPNYMAPEQAAPGTSPVGTPADVWALGVILYEMLTGRPPFHGETAWDVLTQVASAEPPPPRRLRPKTPADLETICLKCLRKEPQRRYGSAEALADDLRRFLTDRPIQARRVGVAERAVKWVRRNAVLTALLGVVVLATAGGGGGGLWAARDRADRLARAEGAADAALHKSAAAADQAGAVEQAADEKGQEEPETPETAKQVLAWRRQAVESLDEAERALADVLGSEAARSRTAERRRAVAVELERAEQAAGLLDELDRARGARAGAVASALDTDSSARLYAAALSAYGLDVSGPEAETAAAIRQARPGVRLALILALDDWASCVRVHDAAEADRLGRLADGADDDDWRRRYRAAADDVSALKRLAEEAPALHLPTVSLVQLGSDLCDRGSRPEAVTLLRLVRRQHPTDFWVYYNITSCLVVPNHPDKATQDEAEGSACTAVALRQDSAAAHCFLGVVLYERGNLAPAAESFKKAVELDPKFATPQYNLGEVLYDQRDLAGAVGCYRKAIELDPALTCAYIGLGAALRDQGEVAGAADSLKKAIELNPKHPYAHNNLGNVLYDQRDWEGAAAAYKKAIELDPKYAAAHNNLGNTLRDQGDLAGAAKCIRKAIELDPNYAPAHNNLGNVLDDQGDRAGAAACYKKAIELDPKYALPQCNLGAVLHDQGDLAGAAACYKKAIELDPKYAHAHLNLGLVLYDRGNLVEAAASYRKAIELDPKLAMAHNNLGNVLRDQRDLAGAADCFKKAIELDQKFTLPLYNLGNVLDDQGDREGAAKCYKMAIELDPKFALAHNGLGRVLYDQRDLEGAAASYKKAIELDPKDATAQSGLGDVLDDQGNLEGAAKCYNKAIELDPKSKYAHNGLGLVLEDQGDREGAAQCYKKAIELDPQYAPAQLNLGNVLRDKGNREGAAQCYKKAIEIDPKYPEAHYNLGLVLLDQGTFAEARTSFQRCLDLLAANALLRASASDQLRQCERLLALATKLGPVLKGEQQPADDAERLGLAEVCRYQRRYAAAARFGRDAFDHDPKRAADVGSDERYAAVTDAARAGCGQGDDAKDLDEKQRADWRRQALDWLRAALALRAKQLDGGKLEDRKAAGYALRYWQADAALAGLRDAAELAKLPADEQEAWRKLWADVEALLKKAPEK